MTPKVDSLDHLVLTVTDIAQTCDFYAGVLGMKAELFQPPQGDVRMALTFGRQKINLHEVGREFEPKSGVPTPGSADLCFLSDASLTVWEKHFRALNVPIEDGPVRRTGANGPLMSLYIRDPDGNLIEVSNPMRD